MNANLKAFFTLEVFFLGILFNLEINKLKKKHFFGEIFNKFVYKMFMQKDGSI